MTGPPIGQFPRHYFDLYADQPVPVLGLPIGVMDADYCRFAKLIAARTRMLADGDRICRVETLARGLETKEKEIAAWFDTALNNMYQGRCFLMVHNELLYAIGVILTCMGCRQISCIRE